MPLFLCHFEITLDLQRRIFRVTGLLKCYLFCCLKAYKIKVIFRR